MDGWMKRLIASLGWAEVNLKAILLVKSELYEFRFA